MLLRRKTRMVEWEQRRTTPRRLTPSSLAGGRRKAMGPHVTERDADLSRLVGVCAHAVLEQWDFTKPSAEMNTVFEQACRCYVAEEHSRLKPDILEDLTRLFGRFVSSEPYKELQRATVLGREVPFVMSLDDGQTMEGVIDLIYRLDGRIWIADYKTDDVRAEDAQGRADHYRSQAEMYSQAVENSLGLPSLSFRLIFLRPGIAIDV
jgi:ATP-dependent helicase/nuclease subunit A